MQISSFAEGINTSTAQPLHFSRDHPADGREKNENNPAAVETIMAFFSFADHAPFELSILYVNECRNV